MSRLLERMTEPGLLFILIITFTASFVENKKMLYFAATAELSGGYADILTQAHLLRLNNEEKECDFPFCGV